MHSAVAFIIFNRPQLTERVFAQIAKARPRKLLVIADGPRTRYPDDERNCAAARAVIDGVDWDCEILTNYSDVNLGCASRVATGLTWVFNNVEEAVVLEDDCVPNASFFQFCDELLEYYRNDERVMHISGNNCLSVGRRISGSYLFSIYTLSWGWATWRRAFRHYDPAIKLWPALRRTQWLCDLLGEPSAVERWQRTFDRTYADIRAVNTWDYQWLFACWAQHGLSILPRNNLVCNIGYGRNATHTTSVNNKNANVAASEMTFPITHPQFMIRDREIDQKIFDQVVCPRKSKTSVFSKMRGSVAGVLPAPVRSLVSSSISRMSRSQGW
jgi:hypothetical protein